MPNQTVYICKPDSAEAANETSIYAMIKEEKAKLGPYKGYIIRRRKKFGEEALEDIFVRPEDFAKYYVPASIMDMALLHDDAFLEVDLAAVESLMPGFANDEADFDTRDGILRGVGKSHSEMDPDDLAALEALIGRI